MDPLYGSPREVAQQMRFGSHNNPWAPGSGGYQHPHDNQHAQEQYADQQNLDHGPHPEHGDSNYSVPLDEYDLPHQSYHPSQSPHKQQDQYADPYAQQDQDPYEDGLEAMLW